MKYDLVLDLNTKQEDQIIKIIDSEQNKKDRSEIKITKSNGKITFNISSKDTTALKASFNHIIKAMEVLDKTQNLIKNG